jgi:glycerophosphoryl diester phosphodiesterase
LGAHPYFIHFPALGTAVFVSKSGSSPSRTAELAKEYSPWIVGHRGCLYQELENTREGFQACADMGCDAVELDVFLSPKCQTLIVFHGGDGGSSIGDGSDARPGLLHDYCGVPGSILDYTYQEALTKLRFNPPHAELACPPEVIARGMIPTLEQVLSGAKQSGFHIKIELKGEGALVPTLQLVEKLDMVRQVSYSSFDLTQLAELRALRKDRTLYPTGACFPPRIVAASEIHLQYDSCSLQRVQEIHQAGMGSMCWMRGPVGMKQDCATKYWDVGNEDLHMYQAFMDTGVQQNCASRSRMYGIDSLTTTQILKKKNIILEIDENKFIEFSTG